LQESIDLEKLRAVFRNTRWWIVLIFLACNLAAYLTTRWTKDIFESESELKLDIKRDATDLGIKNVVQDADQDIVSGEIEQIKSKVFFNKVIDSLDLHVSYFSEGKILYDEMYKRSPFTVHLVLVSRSMEDVPIYFTPLSASSYKLKIGNDGTDINGKYGESLKISGSEFSVVNSAQLNENDPNNFYFVINSREHLVNYLSMNTNVEPLNFRANTIHISFKDYSALKAHDIVNKIDSLYIIYSNEQKNLTNKQKIEWLNRELSHVEKRMEGFENYFEEFTLQNKSSDLVQDMKHTILLINQLDSQRYSLNKKIIEINGLIETIVAGKRHSSSTLYSFLPDYLNKKLEALSLLTQGRDKLALAYNENTLAFKQKDKEINTLKDQVFDQLTSLKENWMKSLAELVDNKLKLERAFISMPDKNTKFSKNQRFYNLFTEFYLSMMQSKAQFEIAQAGNTPDFKILSSASMPGTPVSQRKVLILGVGFMASIVINFFFIGFAYIIDNKVTSIKEIEHALNVPVLGVIPASRVPAISAIHVGDNPKSMLSEAIRSLRTNLDFFTSGGNKKIITISSSISGEGKSFLAMNLGAVLAMSKKKVALIDLDMRKVKKIDPNKGGEQNLGLSTILIKKTTWQACLQKTSIENLDFIPSGPVPPNPSELLLNGEFSSLIDEIQKEYDFILMDTPPVGLVTDGIMAMRKSDLSIYVVRANYTKKDFLKSLNRMIAVNKLSNVAIVLNALPYSNKAYGYGYYEDKPKKQGWRKILPS